jgi:hypothetical protein
MPKIFVPGPVIEPTITASTSAISICQCSFSVGYLALQSCRYRLLGACVRDADIGLCLHFTEHHQHLVGATKLVQ